MTEIDGWRRTQGEARADAFHYIEGFYSKRRLHSAATARHPIVLSQGGASARLPKSPLAATAGGAQEGTMQSPPLLPSAYRCLVTDIPP